MKQSGPLHEYHKKFKKLDNRVLSWTQKALVGTFIGELKPKIAEDIQMFMPKKLKETTSLVCMREDQLNRKRWLV